jgi:hypothetical protein
LQVLLSGALLLLYMLVGGLVMQRLQQDGGSFDAVDLSDVASSFAPGGAVSRALGEHFFPTPPSGLPAGAAGGGAAGGAGGAQLETNAQLEANALRVSGQLVRAPLESLLLESLLRVSGQLVSFCEPARALGKRQLHFLNGYLTAT